MEKPSRYSILKKYFTSIHTLREYVQIRAPERLSNHDQRNLEELLDSTIIACNEEIKKSEVPFEAPFISQSQLITIVQKKLYTKDGYGDHLLLKGYSKVSQISKRFYAYMIPGR